MQVPEPIKLGRKLIENKTQKKKKKKISNRFKISVYTKIARCNDVLQQFNLLNQ